MKTPAFILAATMAFALPHVAQAHLSPPHHSGADCAVPSEIKALRQEIAAIKLDRLLNLTSDQAKALLALSQQAQKRKDEIDRQRKKAEPNFIKAMTAVRDELKKTGEVTPETARKLRLAKGEIDFRELAQVFGELNAKAMEVLTDEQRTALMNFDPRPLAKKNAKQPTPNANGNKGYPPPPPDGMAPPPGYYDAYGHQPPPPVGHPMDPPTWHPPRKKGQHPTMVLLSQEFVPMLKARLK